VRVGEEGLGFNIVEGSGTLACSSSLRVDDVPVSKRSGATSWLSRTHPLDRLSDHRLDHQMNLGYLYVLLKMQQRQFEFGKLPLRYRNTWFA
jgi:hypothetical protein